MLYDSGLDNVTILDSYLLNAKKKCITYLLSLDSKKFLHHFYKTAGLTSPAPAYGGWEGYNGSSYWNFRGHMFGHYMSALSQAYLSGEKGTLKQIKTAVKGLNECQDAYSKGNPESAGYISAFPEADLDIVQQIKPHTVKQNVPGPSDEPHRTVWVPWYNLHKVLAGLIDISKNVKDDEVGSLALQVASSFGDYIYNRISKLTSNKVLLSTEYGGMNDALYELYNLTKNINHKTAAECFDETNLFEVLKQNHDILNGNHANTMIPKFIGALKRYIFLGDNDYLTIAKIFWDIVINHHTYVTGGNSEGEHFHAPDSFGKHYMSERTCETCNTYNMLKLTRELFKITQEKKYADYYENTFINSILSSQNPETGMMTYFQPMGAGYNKVYNLPFEHFYCCTGTGIESFTKLGDSIYFSSEDSIYVNMYFSSIFESKDIKISQEADLLKNDKISFKIKSKKPNIKLYLRIPDWCSEKPVLKINENPVLYTEISKYILIENLYKNNKIELTLPMNICVYNFPDKPETVAFKYAPFVLSTSLGKKDIEKTAIDGVNVRVSVLDESIPKTISIPKDSNLIRIDDSKDGQAQFKLQNTNLIFTPHFMRYDERYGLYMTFTESV